MTATLELVVWAVLLTAAWSCTALKTITLVRNRRVLPNARLRPLRALTAALAAVSAELTLRCAEQHVDRVAGAVGFARFAGYCVIVSGAVAAQAALIYMGGVTQEAIRSVRRRCAVTAAALVVIIVGYAVTPPPRSINDQAVVSGAYYAHHSYTYSGVPALVHLIVLLVACIDVGRLAWKLAEIADRPLLYLGLRIMVASAAVGAVYCNMHIVYLGEPIFGIDIPGGPELSIYAYSAAIILFLLGCTIPSIGQRFHLDAMVHRYLRVVSLRRIQPLWDALQVTNPALVLAPPDELDIRLRHARTVMEIGDFIRAIRPLAPLESVTVACRHATKAGLRDQERAAAIKAAVIAVALANHARITRAARRDAAARGASWQEADAAAARAIAAALEDAEEPDLSPADRAAANAIGQVRFIEHVARAFQRSPIVPAVCAEICQAPARGMIPRQPTADQRNSAEGKPHPPAPPG